MYIIDYIITVNDILYRPNVYVLRIHFRPT